MVWWQLGAPLQIAAGASTELVNMERPCLLRTTWVCFLLLSSGAGFPVKRGPAGSDYSFGSLFGEPSDGVGSGSAYSSSGATSGFGSGSDADLLDSMDGGIAQMIADLLRFSPRDPSPRFPWTFDYVPLGSVEGRLMYPSSHIMHSSKSYQRARDFRSDSKYTQDTLDHILLPGSDLESGSSGHKLRSPGILFPAAASDFKETV